MLKRLLAAAAAVLAVSAGAAKADTVHGAVGDFLSSYGGAHDADLDVVQFSALFNPSAASFHVTGTLAGAIDPSRPGFYVIGINTGAGASHPFGPIGAANVTFDRAVLLQKTGSGVLSGSALALTALIDGDTFTLDVPLMFLPTTGARPYDYGWNLWPRLLTGGLSAIADFAPDNAMLASTPEPGTWALMIGGFGLAGGALRRRRTVAAAASRP